MIFKVAILTYHSIDNSGSVISMAVDKFRFQMETLKRRNFDVISLKELVHCLRGKHPLNPKSVVITFDDGFKNFYHQAYPVLKSFGFKATVFLVAGFVGRTNKWNGQPEEIPTFDLLDWDEILEMSDDGIDFGAHTLNHQNLSEIPFDRAVHEIVESKSMVARRLGRDVLFFAYPYGRLNGSVKDIVAREFYGACSTELGFTGLNSDIHFMPRIDMYYFSRNNFFRWCGKLIFVQYVKIRSILRSFKSFSRIP